MRSRRPTWRLGPLLALVLAGCGQKASVVDATESQPRNDLAKQLSAMSRVERTEYFRQHPEAVSVLTGRSASPQP